MTTYTSENPQYSDSVPIVESTDPVNANNNNAPIKVLQDSIAWLKENAGLKGFVTVPTVSGATSFTYDGTEKGITLVGVDPDLVTVTGDKATDVGDYICTVSLKNSAQYVWKDLTTEPKTFAWSINKVTLTVPSVSSNLTYTGSALHPTIGSYDNTLISVSGDSEINAGDYNVTFSLIDSANYQWSGGSTADQTRPWSIAKATASITPQSNSVTLDSGHTSVQIGLTVTGDGTVTALSDDTSVATATMSGNLIVTIASVNDATGAATVTLSMPATTNYLAASATIAVTATFTTIYGASWDGTSTTAWTRTDAAADFTDPVPYVSGASNYGSPFDSLQPWAGMVKEERTGGTMVKIPKFWYKITQNGAGMKVQIADGPADGFSVSPAHMDRGDGKGERDAVYVGRYHSGSSTKKSKTGETPYNNATRSTMRTQLHNLGSNLWQMDFATRFTLWLLYIVEFADWNSQAKIGYGCGNGSGVQAMGYTDSMPYHTGTTQSSRTSYGLGTQYRYIEGLWDNVYDWLDGCYYNSNGLNIILNPNNFSDSSGGTAVGTPSSGYPSAFTVKDVSGTFNMFIPTAANGSDSTYSCDYWYFGASSPCLFAGGNYSQGLSHGLFCVSCNSVSSSSADLGCRLLELP